MNPVIEVEHFSKTYGDFKAVDDISFTVDEGSIFAFLGLNNAGKTTMIRIMADVLRPDKGRILYNGRDIHDAGDAYRAKIGYLPQDVGFYSDFTGMDHLILSSRSGRRKIVTAKLLSILNNPPAFYVFILTSDKMFRSRPQKTPRFPRRIPDPVWTAGAPCGKSPRERA